VSAAALLIVVLGLGVIAWAGARLRAVQVRGLSQSNSLPAHSGWYAALWTAAPPLLFLAVWATVSPGLVTRAVVATPEAAALPSPGFERASILAEARGLAEGSSAGVFHDLSRDLAPAYAAAQGRQDLLATATALLLAFVGGAYAATRIRPGFAPRQRMERLVMAGLVGASMVAILTTVGIAGSLLFESLRFFRLVPVGDFLFGTHWSPQVIDPRDPGASLGAVPLFWGTFFIGAVIAMAVAVPLGLMSAIYLTQYARTRTRAWAKPMLEVLAGIPTVVYGYFAALTVAPRVRDLGVALGMENASSESALAAGLVMGAMIIPFVSSMADDALAAVPQGLRDGSLALGATPSETCRRVLLPAALPGIVGGVLLAVSRAIGETMIVVMAASGVATLTANPFASTTTVTRQIVDLLTGEGEFESPKTLAAFALGLVLFVVTFVLNIVALGVVKRYREAYD
jgi:phosphate transport system permease protein